MGSILDWMNELVDKLWDKISNALPVDPFSDLIDNLQFGEISKYIGYLNYFFPVGFFLKAFGAFLGSLAVYYLVSIIMRWLKAVS